MTNPSITNLLYVQICIRKQRAILLRGRGREKERERERGGKRERREREQCIYIEREREKKGRPLHHREDRAISFLQGRHPNTLLSLSFSLSPYLPLSPPHSHLHHVCPIPPLCSPRVSPPEPLTPEFGVHHHVIHLPTGILSFGALKPYPAGALVQLCLTHRSVGTQAGLGWRGGGRGRGQSLPSEARG